MALDVVALQPTYTGIRASYAIAACDRLPLVVVADVRAPCNPLGNRVGP
jgi:hypothetical protein